MATPTPPNNPQDPESGRDNPRQPGIVDKLATTGKAVDTAGLATFAGAKYAESQGVAGAEHAATAGQEMTALGGALQVPKKLTENPLDAAKTAGASAANVFGGVARSAMGNEALGDAVLTTTLAVGETGEQTRDYFTGRGTTQTAPQPPSQQSPTPGPVNPVADPTNIPLPPSRTSTTSTTTATTPPPTASTQTKPKSPGRK